MYDKYKQARNMSWEILIKSGVDKLPIDLNQIVDTVNVDVLPYSALGDAFNPEMIDTDGFTTNSLTNKKVICINSKHGTLQRRRFTLAHELGHVVLNHPLKPLVYRNSESDHNQKPEEVQANVFARDLLMPAGVLAALHVTTVDEIIRICSVSHISAQLRLKRLTELYKRGKFGAHPLERKVIAQFKAFISNNK